MDPTSKLSPEASFKQAASRPSERAEISSARRRKTASDLRLCKSEAVVGLTGFEPATPCSLDSGSEKPSSFSEICADLRKQLISAAWLLLDFDPASGLLAEYLGNMCGPPPAGCLTPIPLWLAELGLLLSQPDVRTIVKRLVPRTYAFRRHVLADA